MALFALSLGLYQSYYFTAVSLLLILLILKIVDNMPVREVWRCALKYLGALLLAGIVYFAALKAVVFATGIEPANGYNGLQNLLGKSVLDLLQRIPEAYISFLRFFGASDAFYNRIWIAILLGLGICLWVRYLRQKQLQRNNWILLGLAVVLLPLALNGIYVMAGFEHDMMKFGCLFVFLLLFIPIEKYEWPKEREKPRRKNILYGCRLAVYVICGILIFRSCIYANGVYYYMHLVGERTDQYMAKMMLDIEQVEGYTNGVTPVYIAGVGNYSALAGTWEGFERYERRITGWTNTSITYFDTLKWYFHQKAGFPINLISDPEEQREIESKVDIQAMPIFPKEGYYTMVDGVLVVRFS